MRQNVSMSHTPGGAPDVKRRAKRQKTISSNHCYEAMVGCDLGRPCNRCIRLGKEGPTASGLC